jgi:hypothetical protein
MPPRLCVALALLVLLAQLQVSHSVIDSFTEDMLRLINQDLEEFDTSATSTGTSVTVTTIAAPDEPGTTPGPAKPVLPAELVDPAKPGATTEPAEPDLLVDCLACNHT